MPHMINDNYFCRSAGIVDVDQHTLLDLKGSIPIFVHISDGKLHDVNVLDLLSDTTDLGAV